MSGRTTAQELSDVFYGLQVIVKIMEGLSQEYDSGNRSQIDYEQRFHSQTNLLCKALGDVRPLAEKLISDGYNKYASPERPISSERLLTGGSSDVVEGTQVSREES